MTGRLDIVGLGPGDPRLLTPEASEAVSGASDLIGYSTYLARVPIRAGQRRHVSDNRQELTRARHAISLAACGSRVAVISSGDPGVFAMASAVFEAIEFGDSSWRMLEVRVIPGISAIFAAAARVGAPLGHDFCAISLSDNLKPWPTVTARLHAAAAAGFVIALYNVRSQVRPWQLSAAFDLLRSILPGTNLVILATSITRPDERIVVTTLADADPTQADMRTLVLIGSAALRRIDRPAAPPWIYAPRAESAA